MKSSNNSNGDFLDPRTPDFLDGVLVDFVRNFFGMAHLDMVNLEDISSENNSQLHTQPEINPREAISAIPKKDNSGHRHFLIPASYSNGQNPDIRASDPRSELVNPSKKNEASLDSIDVSQEPTSLVDIFLGYNSPYSIFREISSLETMKGDLNTLFDGFEGKFFPTEDFSKGSSWSSSTTIAISTSPEGVTTTRKTVRHSDGSEEFTETITRPSGVLPQREESLLLTSKASDRFKPSNLLDSVSKWWHDLSL